MRVFVVAAVLCALVQGKPQYNYPAPSPPSSSYRTLVGSSGIGGRLGIGGGDFGGGISTGGTLIQKHIYVHVAPPEPEEFRPQRPLSVGQATKHYKIIFIKAPSSATPTAPTIPLQAQNEEKTLVYVLVKKPDDAPEISVPTTAPTQPSKPEVYFIRYKTQKEAVSGVFGGKSDSTAGPIIANAPEPKPTPAPIGTNVQITLGGQSASGIPGGVGVSGFSSSSITSLFGGTGGRPTTHYGPPGQSGPY